MTKLNIFSPGLKNPKKTPMDLIIEWARKERKPEIREMADLAQKELYDFRHSYQSLIEHHGKHHDENVMDAIGLIRKERIRQIKVEGFTAEHDAEQPGEMAQASASYAIMAARQIIYKKESEKPYLLDPLQHWPWDMKWWKPSNSTLRNLVKAGALIAAEIDRLLGEK